MDQYALKFLLFFLLSTTIYAQEPGNNSPDGNTEYDDYLDFGEAEGITIFAERPRDEYPPDSLEHHVLTQLSGGRSERNKVLITVLSPYLPRVNLADYRRK
jgi:hypothetical protein